MQVRKGCITLRISQQTLNEIKFRNSIEDVVSGYVQLKRSASNLVGLCPFHSEKTPSFTVFPADGSFYCFGCGAGGDVIAFVRRAESLDYPSAVEFLARRAGISIVTDESDKEMYARRSSVLKMNLEAARFFNSCLFDPKYGKEAMEYLCVKRGLSTSLIKHFGLGFAPDNYGMLTRHMSSLGYKDYELSSAFLCGISKKNGAPYDYFRNRIIFPIIDPSGQVVAFGGRVMDDSLPKYLNTSDTPAFRKSRTLFALNYAKDSCAEQMILCEGYMDVIALHGAGFSNAVATLGTAITKEHARLMKRYTKSVVICYDSDDAGQKAADKAFGVLGEVGLEARILKVTSAKDPDEYIKKFGRDGFSRLLKNTESEFQFRLGKILSKYDIANTDQRLKALDEAIGVIAGVQSAAAREIYSRIVSEKFSVSAENIAKDAEKRFARSERQKNAIEKERLLLSATGISDRVNADYVKNPRAASSEEKIIGILLLHPEYIEQMEKKGIAFSSDDFFTSFSKKIVALMLSFEGRPFDISSLGTELSVEETDRLTKLKMDREKLTDNSLQLLTEIYGKMVEDVRRSEMTADEIIKKKREKRKSDRHR